MTLPDGTQPPDLDLHVADVQPDLWGNLPSLHSLRSRHEAAASRSRASCGGGAQGFGDDTARWDEGALRRCKRPGNLQNCATNQVGADDAKDRRGGGTLAGGGGRALEDRRRAHRNQGERRSRQPPKEEERVRELSSDGCALFHNEAELLDTAPEAGASQERVCGLGDREVGSRAPRIGGEVAEADVKSGHLLHG